MGNSKATGFGSLRCQVKVRSGQQDSRAVYLKKGKWGMDGSGLSGLMWPVLGAAPQQGHSGGARPPTPLRGLSPASLPSLLCSWGRPVSPPTSAAKDSPCRFHVCPHVWSLLQAVGVGRATLQMGD